MQGNQAKTPDICLDQELNQTLLSSTTLSAKEIFDQISKGQTVKIPNDPILASQLYKHLNVIKSRTKKLFKELGLDFPTTIVSVIPQQDQQTQQIYYDIKLEAPKEYRKYTAFVLEESNGPSSK